MTNEELMQMMTDMGLHEGGMENWVVDNAWLRVANAVEEREREACAELRKTLSAIPNRHVPQLQPAVESALDFYAERIRARGQA